MPDIRFRNLDKLTIAKRGDKRTLSMNRPTSGTGKVMERCPNEDCQPAVFQLGQAPDERHVSDDGRNLIRREPGTPGATCPYCGTDGDDDEFVHDADVEFAKKQIMHAVEQDVSAMLGDMVNGFNRRTRSSRNSLFSIKMEHKPSRRAKPVAYREDLLRGISCHVCQREYGVYALALFCPDCGSPNVGTHFAREIDIINQQIEISKLVDEDQNHEVAYRLLANAHEDALTALETTLKAIHRHIVIQRFPDKVVGLDKIGNTFQNLEKGEKAFRDLGIELLAAFDSQEKETAFKAIQKRHVIGHNLGLADEKYARVASDAQVGQTVPVLAEEIETFTALCAKLINSLEKELVHGG